MLSFPTSANTLKRRLSLNQGNGSDCVSGHCNISLSQICCKNEGAISLNPQHETVKDNSVQSWLFVPWCLCDEMGNVLKACLLHTQVSEKNACMVIWVISQTSSFFFFFQALMFCFVVFYLFLTLLTLHCSTQAFSTCSEQGGLLSACSAQSSHCAGFSCGAQALGHRLQ